MRFLSCLWPELVCSRWAGAGKKEVACLGASQTWRKVDISRSPACHWQPCLRKEKKSIPESGRSSYLLWHPFHSLYRKVSLCGSKEKKNALFHGALQRRVDATVRYHFTCNKIAVTVQKMSKRQVTSEGEGVEQLVPIHCLWEGKVV